MNRYIFSTIVCAASAAAALTGCGKAHPAPPSERNALILRFFNSMTAGDAPAASEQGEKLRKMDIGNEYIVKLITVQQSNAFLQRAQSEVNAGNIGKALEILNEGVKTYPSNRDLARQRTRVRQLRNAEMLLREMKEAKNSASMSAALTAASTGLSSNMTPKLRAYLDGYRLRIADVAREEAARTAAEPVVGKPAGK
ncbi:MAG: hypothetical protein HPZ91_12540 [Lentisphaeria bacterium]|nr:hypothetical protein [Lentisphaeria bacterium]